MRKKGYEILQRNFRIRGGEIDIVAQNDVALVFVEVKTRTSRAFGEAREAVGAVKQKRIVLAAQHYLMQYGNMRNTGGNSFCRFDVIEIDATHPQIEIRHWENAFECPQ